MPLTLPFRRMDNSRSDATLLGVVFDLDDDTSWDTDFDWLDISECV